MTAAPTLTVMRVSRPNAEGSIDLHLATNPLGDGVGGLHLVAAVVERHDREDLLAAVSEREIAVPNGLGDRGGDGPEHRVAHGVPE